MARTTNCAICGKEITTGFFSGNADLLFVGGDHVDCCPDCYEKYQERAKRAEKRLKIKLENYKTATKIRRLDSRTLVKMLMTYLEEEDAQIARCGKIKEKEDLGYFVVNRENGTFAIREFALGSDMSARDMVKSMEKAGEVGEVWFNKDDVTRMEYRTTFVGDSYNLFSTAFSFEIRLNDEKVITYKPCITRAAFVGKGLFPHSQKRNAKERCAEMLEILRNAIGSNVPVVEVKKFM